MDLEMSEPVAKLLTSEGSSILGYHLGWAISKREGRGDIQARS